MSKGKGSAAAKHDDSLVEGVDVTKVKLSLVVKALDDAEIDSSEMTAGDKVSALQIHNRKTVEKKKLAQCTVCGGFASIDLDSCPFCGDEGLEEGDQEDEEETEESEEEEVGQAAEAKTTKALSLVKTKGKNTEIVPSEDFNEKALDEATARILELKQSGAKTYWSIGQEIAVVYNKELWKTRMDGKKAAYTGFTQYAERELKMSKSSAFDMMDTAKRFSEIQIDKFGGTKLTLLLKAPAKDQPEIMGDIEKGASAKQVREKVKQSRKKAKLNKRETGRKAGPKGTNKGRKAASGRMTVAMVEGKKSLNMWAKPEKKLAEGEKPEKHAMKINDVPFAMEEMDNGVVRFYTVTLGPKGLKLEIETKRAE